MGLRGHSANPDQIHLHASRIKSSRDLTVVLVIRGLFGERGAFRKKSGLISAIFLFSSSDNSMIAGLFFVAGLTGMIKASFP
jgi:hypothetical protein